MPRPVWKGHVSFGLVNVPIVLYPAEQRADLRFHLVDSRNMSRVRYERVNEETGEEVPWDKIVKGYEYNGGNYVLLSDEELETASVEMTRTIEVEQFVDVDEIDVTYFDKPYFLVPGKGGEKGYVLLREALAGTKKAGIARVVIHTRQYLAALLAHGDALILNLLRFSQELRQARDFDLPGHGLAKLNISKSEINLARQLVEGMTEKWDADKFHDDYRDALLTLIEKKVKSGRTETIESEEPQEQSEPQTVNFMDALKESVAQAKKPARKMKKAPSRRRRSGKKKRAS